MGTMKHSRQRDSIIAFLEGAKDHPTADTIYNNLRQEYPNISLGTVYRNLGLLCDIGEIVRINVPGQPERYDFTTSEHYHFVCKNCGRVVDLPTRSLGELDALAGQAFDGIITEHICQFFGYCAECK